MFDPHCKERFDDEMTGIHAAEKNTRLEEKEWERLEAEEGACERQIETHHKAKRLDEVIAHAEEIREVAIRWYNVPTRKIAERILKIAKGEK